MLPVFGKSSLPAVMLISEKESGADFTGTGILQDIKICDRELCVCRGHPEDISNYGR